MAKRSGLVLAAKAAAIEVAPTAIVVGVGAFAAFLLYKKLQRDVATDPTTRAAVGVASAVADAAKAAAGVPAWAWYVPPITMPIYGATKAAEWVAGQVTGDPPVQGGGGESGHGGASGDY